LKSKVEEVCGGNENMGGGFQDLISALSVVLCFSIEFLSIVIKIPAKNLNLENHFKKFP
jgi:hypothetical protein